MAESVVKNRDSVESRSGDCRDHGVFPQAATHPLPSTSKNSGVKGIQLPRRCRRTKTWSWNLEYLLGYSCFCFFFLNSVTCLHVWKLQTRYFRYTNMKNVPDAVSEKGAQPGETSLFSWQYIFGVMCLSERGLTDTIYCPFSTVGPCVCVCVPARLFVLWALLDAFVRLICKTAKSKIITTVHLSPVTSIQTNLAITTN